jgi:hypothetical protein
MGLRRMIWRKQRAVLLLQMSVMSFEGLTLIPAENFKSAEMDFSAIHLEVVVCQGHALDLYFTWSDYPKQVLGLWREEHKNFRTSQEAEEYFFWPAHY